MDGALLVVVFSLLYPSSRQTNIAASIINSLVIILKHGLPKRGSSNRACCYNFQAQVIGFLKAG